MNYQKNYDDYIAYVKALGRKKGGDIYYEIHHIIPRSMNGGNDEENLVLLTLREHYLAHYLLWKIHRNKQMNSAFMLMNSFSKYSILNSKMYEKLREEFYKNNSANRKVICIETKEVFDSVTRTMEKYNRSVISALRDKRNTASGLHFDYYEEGKVYEVPEKKEHYKCKKVICLETKEVFKSMTEASKKFGIIHSSISRNINGEASDADGYHFDFYKEGKDYPDSIRVVHKGAKRKVICIETGEIFESVTEATKKYKSSVDDSLKHKYLTSCGLHFDYYEEGKTYELSEEKRKNLKRKVICLETKEVFDGIIEAERNFGCFNIGKVLKGELKTSGGFHFEFYEEGKEYQTPKKEKHYKCRKIICLETGEEFESIKEAADKLGIGRNHIGDVCRGERKSVKGFMFKFKED